MIEDFFELKGNAQSPRTKKATKQGHFWVRGDFYGSVGWNMGQRGDRDSG